MALYKHRIDTQELDTRVAIPVEGTAGLQVIFGTAPVNMAENPSAAVNTPIIAYSYEEAVKQLGFSYDFDKYTLCQSIYANFVLFQNAPIILVNVLDPSKVGHTKAYTSGSVTVANKKATLDAEGILLATLTVTAGEVTLTKGTDYIAAFNSAGGVDITLLDTAATASVTAISATGTQLDPDGVTAADIVGGYDASTGAETGIECVRKVYPKLGLVPGLLLAPGWSSTATVAAALRAKTTELNGLFTCEAVIDMGAAAGSKYTDLNAAKTTLGVIDEHCILLWPMLKVGDYKMAYSAIWAAMTSRCDTDHGDVPYKSPSNELLGVSAAILADGTEVLLDINQAELVNSYGIVTAINNQGWKSWGNNTSIYPSSTDPKDRWIACRRMMSWYRNHFILTYHDKVDDPASYRLTEAFVDSENMYLNSLTASGAIAGGVIEFNEEENPITEILDGNIVFYTRIAFWTPAKYILNKIEFDPTILSAALGGE